MPDTVPYQALRWVQRTLPAVFLVLPALIRNAWIANAFNNLIGFSGLAGSGIRMLLLAGKGIDVRRSASFSAFAIRACKAYALQGAPARRHQKLTTGKFQNQHEIVITSCKSCGETN